MSPGIANETEFSLAPGGPLYRLYLRAGLVRPPLELLGRRIVVVSLLAWLPLALLTALAGNFMGGIHVPFLKDFDVQLRFLLALPMLIGAEAVVHQRLPGTVRQFLDRNLVEPEDRARFDAMIAGAMRLRDSTV